MAWRYAKFKGRYYLDYLNKTGVVDYQSAESNQGVDVSRRIEEDRAHILFISLWEPIIV